jgi:hypothetical protein
METHPLTATNLTALKAAQRSLLLKPLDAAVFLAPWYTPAPLGMFTDTGANLQTLPAGYQSVGLIDKKSGVAFARAVTAAPIESYGELQPTRDDLTSDITTLEFEPQETTQLTLALATNANLQQATVNATSGETYFAQPPTPQIVYYSAIVIGKDGTDAAPIYVFKIMPKVAVTKWAGENWAPTNLMSQKMTLTAFKDDTAGFAVAHGFGGIGWKNLVTKTGLAAVTAITVTPATLALGHTGTAAVSAPLTVADQFGAVIPNSGVTFSTSAASIATVAATGVVTGVAAGSATITGSYTPAGSFTALTATCVVTVS